MTVQQTQTYEELREQFKSATKKMAVVYVPQMAEALEHQNPDWDIYKLKETILDDTEADGWNRQYIERVINQFVSRLNENNKYHDRTMASWKAKHKKKLDFANQTFANLNKIDIPMPPEPEEKDNSNMEPLDDEDLDAAGIKMRPFGSGNKSLRAIESDIYVGASKLFRALCNDRYMPNASEDLLVDYIKPTREYRLGLALEWNKKERNLIHNAMHNIVEIAEDMIDQIKKADKK